MCSITLFHYVRINCVFLNKDCCFRIKPMHNGKKNLPGNPGRPMNCRINCNQNQSEILRHPTIHRNAGIDSGINGGLDIWIVIELDLDISRIFLEGNLVGQASV